jgi:acetolactate synthase-1/2/3 large subunit
LNSRVHRSPSTIELPAAHAILEILEAEGVEYVFGVPGGPLTSFFEALQERQSIRFVLAKHEGAAAFMAATYARVSGKLGVCCVTSGPGATNALTGIASAHADSLPVLILTGQVATHVFGKGAIQESSVFGTDLVEMFRPVTRQSTMFPSVGRIPDLLRGAIRTAFSGRRGPVHLSMPADLLSRPTRFSQSRPERYRPGSRQVDLDAIARAATLLAGARRPCILAGHGVALSGAEAELLALAHAHRIPVATSPKGKGCFPERDPLSLGVLGFGGHDQAERYLGSGEVDVLLVVGSSLNEFVTNAWTLPARPRQALMQLDVDATVIGRNMPVDVAMVGDARASLSELSLELARVGVPERPADPLSELRAMVPRHIAAEVMTSDAVPLKPQRLLQEMRRAMPDDAMLFVDNGTAIIWAGHYFEARQPRTYFIDLGLAAMGSAVAGVIGGALAAPDRRAVALVGDAAFAMNGAEVHSAAEQGLPVTWVVINNGGHGMVSQGETLMKGKNLGTSVFRVPLDVTGMARSLGAHAVRVQTPSELQAALAEAMARQGGPTVIDAVVDPQELPPTLVRRAQTLAEFAAMRRRTDPPASIYPSSTPPRMS